MADNVVARATVELDVEDRKLKSGLDKAEKQTKRFGDRASSSFKRAGESAERLNSIIGKIAIPAAIAGTIAGIVDRFKQARDAAEQFQDQLDALVLTSERDLTRALGRSVEGLEKFQQQADAALKLVKDLEKEAENRTLLSGLIDQVGAAALGYETLNERIESANEALNEQSRNQARAAKADADARAAAEAQRLADEERAKEEAQAKDLARIEERRIAEERSIEARAEKQRLADEERERRIMEQIERERQARIETVRSTFAEIEQANRDALGLNRIVTELQLVGDRIEQAITRRSR